MKLDYSYTCDRARYEGFKGVSAGDGLYLREIIDEASNQIVELSKFVPKRRYI